MTTALLAFCCLWTAIVSAIWGVGGGTILVAIMANFFPAKQLIPIHGVLQLLSYGGTAALSWRNIHARILSRFTLGAIVGATAGALLIPALPDRAMKIAMALSVLLGTWLPPLDNLPRIRGKFVTVGALGSFLSIFVGSTGPFMSPFFLRQRLSKEQLIATKAACQVVLHFCKITAFAAIGFAYANFAGQLAIFSLATLCGVLAGKLLLRRMPQFHFELSLKLLLTGLALKILYSALT